MPYKLGKPYTWDEETNRGEGECVFCGKVIEHFNDGGVGWVLEAAHPETGKLDQYIHCCYPMCPESEANDAAEIHRCYNPDQVEGWTLDPSQTYDTCDDFGSYCEFLGDRCPDCGGTVAEVDARLYDPRWAEFFGKEGDARPWAWSRNFTPGMRCTGTIRMAASVPGST